jgi:type IV fimbrial biogenesis protein FimT
MTPLVDPQFDQTEKQVTLRIGNSAGGFTLIELMIVMVILAVVLMIAGPGFMEANLNTKLKSYSNQMLSSALLARGEAIKRNVPVRLCASANGIACAGSGDWEQGWVVLDPNDVVIGSQPALTGGFKMTSTGGATLTFQPSGVAGTSTTLRLCRLTPEVGKQERLVTISATGRPSISRTTTATCP